MEVTGGGEIIVGDALTLMLMTMLAPMMTAMMKEMMTDGDSNDEWVLDASDTSVWILTFFSFKYCI